MRPKLAICTNFFHPSVGGGEIVVKKIVEHLSKDYDVFVFARRHPGRNHGDFSNYKVVEYSQVDFAHFSSKLNQVNPDLVMIYSDLFDFFRNIAGSGGQYKLIIAPCGANWLYSHGRGMKILQKQMFRRTDAIICHSSVDRDYAMFSGMGNKLHIIPNGVELENFNDNQLTRNDLCAEGSQKRWILNVSNFFPGKGQEYLPDILQQLPSPENICYFQLCNSLRYPFALELEAKWKSNISQLTSIGMQVKLLHDLPREKVIGFFKQSNVFVFPSEKEVAPLVLLEAMAAELPWVSCDVGNSTELEGGLCIKTSKNSSYHSLIDKRVKKAFAMHIQTLWNNSYPSGKKQIEEKFCWEKILPQYSSLISRFV